MLKGCDIEVIAFIFMINEDESLFVISESLLTTYSYFSRLVEVATVHFGEYIQIVKMILCTNESF